MATFGSIWWVFLLIFVVLYGYVIFNQVRRMKSLLRDDDGGDISKGLTSFALAAFLGTISFILFWVSLICWFIKG